MTPMKVVAASSDIATRQALLSGRIFARVELDCLRRKDPNARVHDCRAPPMPTALPLPVLAYWTHHLKPFLFKFSDNFGIRYYGLSYLLGFVAAWWLFKKYWKAGRSPLGPDQIADLIVALVLGVMIGGRLGSFLLYHPDQLIHDPLSFFRVWEGGMASHGGMAGVAAALIWFARSRHISFRILADLIVSVAPAGLFFGRIANFINGELWGKPAVVPWAIIFPDSPHPLVPRHPSQLYEAGLEGLVLFVYMQIRFWRSAVTKESPGQLAGEFLLGYALVRAIGEIFREPDAGLILGLSRGTFYSIFLVIAGAGMIAWSRAAPRDTSPHP